MAPRTVPLVDRALSRFTVGDDCWEWTGTRRNGYGRITRGGHCGPSLLAHRVVYELLEGPIPEGLVLDHLCRNTGCVRPSHLEPVLQAENVRRGSRWPK